MESNLELTIENAAAALTRHDDERAFEMFMSLAKMGSVFAMLMVGRLYRSGRGVEKDNQMACHWYEMACGKNDISSRIFLYDIYVKGVTGVEKDQKRAFDYVKNYMHIEAPSIGEALVMYRVGLSYEFGYGVEKNINTALKIYSNAMKAGHIPSKINFYRRLLMRGNVLAVIPLLLAIMKAQYLVIISRIKNQENDLRLW